jgi:hypothetical protein
MSGAPEKRHTVRVLAAAAICAEDIPQKSGLRTVAHASQVEWPGARHVGIRVDAPRPSSEAREVTLFEGMQLDPHAMSNPTAPVHRLARKPRGRATTPVRRARP